MKLLIMWMASIGLNFCSLFLIMLTSFIFGNADEYTYVLTRKEGHSLFIQFIQERII